jgi:serine/threonine-protein kinase
MPETSKTIGRFVLDRILGQGAMGVVYLAEDPLLKRRVAIKVVRAVGEERNRALERFRREAEISAQLNHPNIVTIYDVGDEPGAGPFIAMEYVEGDNLGKLIREGFLDLETRFSILIQTMRALRAAHRHAIVHRDVKPENILVAEDGRVKLMDFGIARTMAPQLTHPGEFLGSPAYSAPELLRGSEPTPSSDRYSFAVTAFELLTGHLPHPGSTVAAVITHVLMEPPVIPQGMSGDLAKIFRQALAQDPDERPGSLTEFLVALMDAQNLSDFARGRIQEMFRNDDYAGDIVPLRQLRAAARAASEARGEGAGAGRSSETYGAPGRSTAAGRSTAGRTSPPRPLPILQPPAVKIELEEDNRAPQKQQSSGRRRRGEPDLPVTPMQLIRWFLFILVFGQVAWWAYHYLQANSGH